MNFYDNKIYYYFINNFFFGKSMYMHMDVHERKVYTKLDTRHD